MRRYGTNKRYVYKERSGLEIDIQKILYTERFMYIIAATRNDQLGDVYSCKGRSEFNRCAGPRTKFAMYICFQI